jgi:hypothetical protein
MSFFFQTGKRKSFNMRNLSLPRVLNKTGRLSLGTASSSRFAHSSLPSFPTSSISHKSAISHPSHSLQSSQTAYSHSIQLLPTLGKYSNTTPIKPTYNYITSASSMLHKPFSNLSQSSLLLSRSVGLGFPLMAPSPLTLTSVIQPRFRTFGTEYQVHIYSLFEEKNTCRHVIN